MPKQQQQQQQQRQEEEICTNCGERHSIVSCPYPRAPQR